MYMYIFLLFSEKYYDWLLNVYIHVHENVCIASHSQLSLQLYI